MGQIGFVVDTLKNVEKSVIPNSPGPLNIMNVLCVVNSKWEATSFANCKDLVDRIALLRKLGIAEETIAAANKSFVGLDNNDLEV